MQTRRPSRSLRGPNGAQNGRRPARVIYPESDGKPMAESQLHIAALIRALLTVEDRFAGNPLIFVGADLFLYYEEGNPKACVAPDLFVAKGVPKLPLRGSYKLWQEKVPPCFVVEFTSASTAAEDRRKLAIYARLGVAECFLYDPRLPAPRQRTPALQGYRLGVFGYETIPEEPDGGLVSEELGLRLSAGNGWLELHDRATGMRLLDPRERMLVGERRLVDEATARQAAERQAAEEATARHAAEARLAELEALLREQRPPPA